MKSLKGSLKRYLSIILIVSMVFTSNAMWTFANGADINSVGTLVDSVGAEADSVGASSTSPDNDVVGVEVNSLKVFSVEANFTSSIATDNEADDVDEEDGVNINYDEEPEDDEGEMVDSENGGGYRIPTLMATVKELKLTL